MSKRTNCSSGASDVPLSRWIEPLDRVQCHWQACKREEELAYGSVAFPQPAEAAAAEHIRKSIASWNRSFGSQYVITANAHVKAEVLGSAVVVVAAG